MVESAYSEGRRETEQTKRITDPLKYLGMVFAALAAVTVLFPGYQALNDRLAAAKFRQIPDADMLPDLMAALATICALFAILVAITSRREMFDGPDTRTAQVQSWIFFLSGFGLILTYVGVYLTLSVTSPSTLLIMTCLASYPAGFGFIALGFSRLAMLEYTRKD